MQIYSSKDKTSVISSLIWKFLERGGTQGIQFIVQIVLARILEPHDFGAITLIAIFISIANVFVQSGFNTSLIQKKEIDDTDLSSAFYISFGLAIILYLVLFFMAPMIADFYHEPVLNHALRILALTLFFGAFNSIQNAIIARNMQFRKLFFCSLLAMAVSGSVGVVMAFLKFGVWALVIQQLVNAATISVIMCFAVKWHPKKLFSIQKVKHLTSFGWKILVTNLINAFYNDLANLVIGKKYKPQLLAYYNKGNQFPLLITSNVDSSIQSVMLTVYSRYQDQRDILRSMMRRSIKTSSYVLFPLLFGLAAVAEPLVVIVLTDKWLPCVAFMQIACISYAFYPIHSANLQAINAMGRSDIFLKIELIKKGCGLLILLSSFMISIYAVAWSGVVTGLIATIINAYPNKKLLGYSIFEQWKDIIPALSLSLLMSGVVWCIQLFNLNPGVIIIIQIFLGASVYILLSAVFHLESFHYILSTIKEYRNFSK